MSRRSRSNEIEEIDLEADIDIDFSTIRYLISTM